jgi:excisionase family DNA binding protein
MNKDLYTAMEVAQLLGLHIKTVRNYVREGKLKSVRFGKQYRITRADLEAFTGGKLDVARDLQGPVATEASSVVEVDGINAGAAERIVTLIMGASKGRKESQALRVETIYDEVRARLKIVILGSLESTRVLLGMIEHLAQRPALGK